MGQAYPSRKPGIYKAFSKYSLVDGKKGFPGGAVVKNLLAGTGDGRDPWVGKIPWRRHPTPGFLPGKSHRQRSLVGYSPGVMKSQTQLSRWKEGKDKGKEAGRETAGEWQVLNRPVPRVPPLPHTDEAFVSFLVPYRMSRAHVAFWAYLRLGRKAKMCLILNSRDMQE